MWGAGFLLGVALAIIFWLIVIAPGDRAHHRKRLEIIKNKLKRIEETKNITNKRRKMVKRMIPVLKTHNNTLKARPQKAWAGPPAKSASGPLALR